MLILLSNTVRGNIMPKVEIKKDEIVIYGDKKSALQFYMQLTEAKLIIPGLKNALYNESYGTLSAGIILPSDPTARTRAEKAIQQFAQSKPSSLTPAKDAKPAVKFVGEQSYGPDVGNTNPDAKTMHKIPHKRDRGNKT